MIHQTFLHQIKTGLAIGMQIHQTLILQIFHRLWYYTISRVITQY